MDKYEIVRKVEEFAPLENQEAWDCSGWAVNVNRYDEISKIMLCLTVTDDVIHQAKEQNCDMIISHHPLFFIPIEWKDINVYCSHTNLDKSIGGTTDTLIKNLGLAQYKTNFEHDFLRIIEYKTTLDDFSKIIKTISPNARVVNNRNIKTLDKIAFCAGSGSEFIAKAAESGADCLVTGDLKFHTSLESPIVLYDIGHFESEILVLPVFKHLIGTGIEIIYAREKSPFEPI
ncbi:Nif3-like dinuclear metal center hexameric protein [bacterium]|nr:Nif3-like dinuclear metal center hexameric protein [bacterium]